MNAPIPPDDVDSVTVPPPWTPPARAARRSGRVITGIKASGPSAKLRVES